MLYTIALPHQMYTVLYGYYSRLYTASPLSGAASARQRLIKTLKIDKKLKDYRLRTTDFRLFLSDELWAKRTTDYGQQTSDFWGCELWAVSYGLWAVSCELWAVSCELWALSKNDYRLRTTDFRLFLSVEQKGLQTTDYGLQTTDYRLLGLWAMSCELWAMSCEPWAVSREPWAVSRELWAVSYEQAPPPTPSA